jgi:hypothetical protein
MDRSAERGWILVLRQESRKSRPVDEPGAYPWLVHDSRCTLGASGMALWPALSQ